MLTTEPKISFETKKIADLKADALVIWTSSSFLAGDERFLEVHLEAGSTLKKEVYNIKYDYNLETFKLGENIITNAGILNVDKIIHSILPNHRLLKNQNDKISVLLRTLYNINETIKRFEETNYKILNLAVFSLSTKLFGEIDRSTIETFLTFLKANYKSFHTITIIFDNDIEKIQYETIFNEINSGFKYKIKKYARYFGINFNI